MNVTVIAADAFRAGVLVEPDDGLQDFGINQLSQLGGADDVAVQNRKLSPLAVRLGRLLQGVQ